MEIVLATYTNRDGDRDVVLTQHETDGKFSLGDVPAGGRRPGTYFPLIGVFETRREAECVAGRHIAPAFEFGTYEARAVTEGICSERQLRAMYDDETVDGVVDPTS